MLVTEASEQVACLSSVNMKKKNKNCWSVRQVPKKMMHSIFHVSKSFQVRVQAIVNGTVGIMDHIVQC